MITETHGTLWHYLGSFIAYTLAVIGLLYGTYAYLKKNPKALLFQKGGKGKDAQALAVESTLVLEPRKNLYVVRCGEERFLLVSSAEGTRLISRLEGGETVPASPTATNGFNVAGLLTANSQGAAALSQASAGDVLAREAQQQVLWLESVRPFLPALPTATTTGAMSKPVMTERR